MDIYLLTKNKVIPALIHNAQICLLINIWLIFFDDPGEKNQNQNCTMWLGPRAKYEWKIDNGHQSRVQWVNFFSKHGEMVSYKRITAYGMIDECCKIYLRKLWLFSPPSTCKLTIYVTSYTWNKNQTVI